MLTRTANSSVAVFCIRRIRNFLLNFMFLAPEKNVHFKWKSRTHFGWFECHQWVSWISIASRLSTEYFERPWTAHTLGECVWCSLKGISTYIAFHSGWWLRFPHVVICGICTRHTKIITAYRIRINLRRKNQQNPFDTKLFSQVIYTVVIL